MINILIALLFTFSLYAKEGGNGGVSMVCRDASQKLVSAEILDLYEGRTIFKKTYAQDSVDALIQFALSRLEKYPGFLNQTNIELSGVKKNFTLISAENELLLTDDALPTIKKKGCRYEQLATYTSDGFVLVSEEIFEALPSSDKAALYLHEAIFALYRKLGVHTSIKTRRLVSQLFATDPDLKVIEENILSTDFVFGGNFKYQWGPKNFQSCKMEFDEVKKVINFGGMVKNCWEYMNKLKSRSFEPVVGFPLVYRLKTWRSPILDDDVIIFFTFTNENEVAASFDLKMLISGKFATFKRYTPTNADE